MDIMQPPSDEYKLLWQLSSDKYSLIKGTTLSDNDQVSGYKYELLIMLTLKL